MTRPITRVVHVNLFITGRHATVPANQISAAVSEILRDHTVMVLFEAVGLPISDVDVEAEEKAR